MSEWIIRVSDKPSIYQLTEPERNNNAYCFFSEMSNKGWSLEAIAGALGNIREESHFNPGACEIGRGQPSANSEYYGGGLGLIQWTDYPPYTCQYVNPLLWYASQVGGTWWNGNLQCDLIDLADDPTITDCGVGQGARWGWLYNPTAYIPFDEYKVYSGSVDDATTIWLYSLERGGYDSLSRRQFYANYYYEWLTGQEPDIPTDPDSPSYDMERKSKIWFAIGRHRRYEI